MQEVCPKNDFPLYDSALDESSTISLVYYYPGGASLSATYSSSPILTSSCSDTTFVNGTYTSMTVYEVGTTTQPSFIDVSGTTFSLNSANWLLNITDSISVYAIRNFDRPTFVVARQRYDLSLVYCKIDD